MKTPVLMRASEKEKETNFMALYNYIHILNVLLVSHQDLRLTLYHFALTALIEEKIKQTISLAEKI